DPDRARARRYPRRDRAAADLRLAGSRQHLRGALAADRHDRFGQPGGRGAVGLPGRLDAPVHPAAPGVRPGQRLGSVRRDARGRDGPRHLLHRGELVLARHAPVIAVSWLVALVLTVAAEPRVDSDSITIARLQYDGGGN